MSLSDFSSVTVTGDGPALTQVGFGTLLLAAYHTHNTDRTRVYTSLTEMVADSFTTDEAAYLMAQVAFSQSPRVPNVKVGRLANAPVPSIRLTPTAVNSATYSITIKVSGDDEATASYTADSATTVGEICDGLVAAITTLALTGVTATLVGTTPDGTNVDVTATAGLLLTMSDWDRALLSVEDKTPDPGIAADLAAIRLADADWYGLAVSHNSEAICEEAADWAETEDVIFACNTSDDAALDTGVSTDIQSVLKAKSYIRTICGFDEDDMGGYMGAGMLAERLPFDPGLPPYAGGTFNAKTLAGVTADTLTPTQKAALTTKGYTVYITTADVSHTLGGKSASGEWLDKTRFVDWYRIRQQELLAQVQLNNDRVPYDERGISLLEAACRAQLKAGLASGGISPTDENGNPPSVVMKALADTTSIERGARTYGAIQIAWKYAGAIHNTTVQITVTT
jgi:hypothetical protein